MMTELWDGCSGWVGQVRSVSFTPAPLLALMAYGRTTGIVCDVGYWETTVVPVSRDSF
jgi:actin-related protein